MALQHVAFQCTACDLTIESDVGAAGDAALKRVFWCGRDERVWTLNVQEGGFEGRCPTCGSQLTLLADFPLDACPRCHAPAAVDKTPRRGSAVSHVSGTGR